MRINLEKKVKLQTIASLCVVLPAGLPALLFTAVHWAKRGRGRGRKVEGVGHKTKDEEGRGGGGAGEEGGITLALVMGAVDTTTSQQ